MASIGIHGGTNISFSQKNLPDSTDILYIEDSHTLGQSEREVVKQLGRNKHLHVVFHTSSTENPAKTPTPVKNELNYGTWHFFHDTFSERFTWTTKNSYAPDIREFLKLLKENIDKIKTANTSAQREQAIADYQSQFARLDYLFTVLSTPLLIRLYFLCQNILAVRFYDGQCSGAEPLLFPNGAPGIRITDKNRKLVSAADYWKTHLGYDGTTTVTEVEAEFHQLVGFDERTKSKVQRLVQCLYTPSSDISNQILLDALSALQHLQLRLPVKNKDYVPCLSDYHAIWINKANTLVHGWLKAYIAELQLFLQNSTDKPSFLTTTWEEWTQHWRSLRALTNALEDQLDLSAVLPCVFLENSHLPRDFQKLVKDSWASHAQTKQSCSVTKQLIETIRERYKKIHHWQNNGHPIDRFLHEIRLQSEQLTEVYNHLEYFRQYALYLTPPLQKPIDESTRKENPLSITTDYSFEQTIGKVLIIDDELGRAYSTISDKNLLFNEKRKTFCYSWGLDDLTVGIRKGNAAPVVAKAVFLSGQKAVPTSSRLKTHFENYRENERSALKESIETLSQQHRDISLILMDMTFEEKTIVVDNDYSIREIEKKEITRSSDYAFFILKIIDEIAALKLIPIVILSQYKPHGIEESLAKTRYLNFISKLTLDRKKLLEIILKYGIISVKNIPSSFSSKISQKQAFRNYFSLTRRAPNEDTVFTDIPKLRASLAWLVLYYIRKFGSDQHREIVIQDNLIDTILDFATKSNTQIKTTRELARLIDNLMEWLPSNATEITIAHFNALPGVYAIKTPTGILTGHDDLSKSTSLDVLLDDFLSGKTKVNLPIPANFDTNYNTIKNINFFLKIHLWESIWNGLPEENRTGKNFTKIIGLKNPSSWGRDFISRHLRDSVPLFIKEEKQRSFLLSKSFLKTIYIAIPPSHRKGAPDEIERFFDEYDQYQN